MTGWPNCGAVADAVRVVVVASRWNDTQPECVCAAWTASPEYRTRNS